MTEEIKEICGYICTHWDCPNCEAENVEEGDAAGDEVICMDCHKTFRITETK